MYTLISAQCNIAVVILLLYQSMTCSHTAITFSYFIAYTFLDINVREVVGVQLFLNGTSPKIWLSFQFQLL